MGVFETSGYWGRSHHMATVLREVLGPLGAGVCPWPSEDRCEVRSSRADRGFLQALPLAEHLELLCGGGRTWWNVSLCALGEWEAVGHEARLTCHVPDGLSTVVLSQRDRLQHVSSPLDKGLSLYCVRGEQSGAQGPKETWRVGEREGQLTPGPWAFESKQTTPRAVSSASLCV